MSWRMSTVCLSAILLLSLVSSGTSALAAGGPAWTITSVSGPTVFPVGSTADEYVITATNAGAAATTAGEAIGITDQLPPGIVATGISGVDLYTQPLTALTCQTAPLECKYTPDEVVDVGDVLRVTITVEARGPFSEPRPVNRATVSGGGAGEASTSDPTTVGSLPAAFGIADFSTSTSTTQAGAHPNLTAAFTFDQSAANVPVDDPRNIELELPPGLIGDANPTAIPRCNLTGVVSGTCPPDAAVGMAAVVTNVPGSERAEPFVSPVYSIVPYSGEPAAFAFTIDDGLAQARLDTSVRSNGDYGMRVSITDISEQEPILSSSVTLWGVPELHNGTAGPDQAFPNALDEPVRFGGRGDGVAAPFLTLPTDCSGQPLNLSLSSDSWQGPIAGPPVPATLPPVTGCDLLSFVPSIDVLPGSFESGAPAGYAVDVKVPQNEDPDGLAASAVRDVQVTLPQGTAVSPSAANGLYACTEAQFGLHSGRTGECQPQSTVGTVKITTPLLLPPLEGHVFLGQSACSPCTPADAQEGRLVPLLLEAEGSGMIIKLAGATSINQETGQLTTTFDESPQLPFSSLEMSLKGGEDALLVNPSGCGPAIATAHLTPWSTITAADVSAPPIPISGCSAQSFSPSLAAGMTTTAQAGAYSGFSIRLSRPDGQQDLDSLTVSTPPGLLGALSKVSLCGESQASSGTCPASSRIGSASVTIGPGSMSLAIEGGSVYLTGPYAGQPFGLSIAVPAEAGPFKLAGTTGQGSVVIRASIAVNPHTAALTISSGALPRALDGIPLDIRTVSLDVDREGFMFNPTNCNAMSIGGTVTSTSGTAAGVSSAFQSVNCATLPFKPKLTVSTSGRTSRANGTSLVGKLTFPDTPQGSEANVAKVKVDIPEQLPSRLTTLQKACTAATFEANPASCPAASVVGHARAITLITPVPLEGPAYFVSHGGEAFPSLIIVLQGYGITMDLAGETFISKAGVTSSTFRAVPDVPVSTLELTFPEGEYSALGANGDLCTSRLAMPTALVGQNGAEIHESTPIDVTGCRPAIGVLRHSVKDSTATIVVSVPSAGRLVATGSGLSRAVARAGKRGQVTVRLTLSKSEQGYLGRHPGRRLKVDVRLLFTPERGSRLSSHATVLMG